MLFYLVLLQNELPGAVELRNVDNHSLNTATALLHLPATAESCQQLEGYFTNCLGVSEAMKYHTTVLELRSDATDGSVNPKYSTVHLWHDEWRRCDLRIL